MPEAGEHLCYLVHTLAWMGGDRAWPADVIAEQLGECDDPRIPPALQEAVGFGLVVEVEGGFQLTDAGWALGALDTPSR
ncbi:MAG TPA: hypothetical protein VME22_01970 [Solirubrobacteraceae bacterium]|nr:hypothetical protein [Solirubrobacteraceae bacterium]